MYRISEQEMLKQQEEYKKNYAPFRPYIVPDSTGLNIINKFKTIIATQNGMDSDDYSVDDNNKVEAFLSYLPKGSKVLLLGVGTGRETKVAWEMGLDAYGTTLGSRNVDFGINNLNLAPDRHQELLCEDLPFEKETFDAVAGFQIFEHTMMPMLFLLELGRVLKTGGRLILEWPPADNYTMGDNPHHQVCYTPGQAEALYMKSGFEDIKLTYKNGNNIPEELWWDGRHNDMLVATGTKKPSSQEYINQFWDR